MRLVGNHELGRRGAGDAVAHDGEQVLTGEPVGGGGHPERGVDLGAPGQGGELDRGGHLRPHPHPHRARGGGLDQPGLRARAEGQERLLGRVRRAGGRWAGRSGRVLRVAGVVRVTALTIHPEDVEEGPLVTAAHCDANDPAQLVPAIRGHDVVVTSIQYRKTNHEQLIASVRESGVPRWFVAGGSGTLLIPGTSTRIMDGPDFPASFAAAAHFWELLERVTDLDWVYLSPPPGIGPGERTGVFRRGREELLVRDDGAMPSISYADYALAIADEIENPELVRQRFTVAY